MKKWLFIFFMLFIECCSTSKKLTYKANVMYSTKEGILKCIEMELEYRSLKVEFKNLQKQISDSLVPCEGIVIDSLSNDSLFAVNVVVCNSNRGCVTDTNGRFVFDNLQLNDTLKFKYIGYIDKKISIRNVVTYNKFIW